MTGRTDQPTDAEAREPERPRDPARRELLRQMTQDSIDMGLYDTTAEQLAGTVNTDTPQESS